ncbi:hypothetical protein JCM8547_004246 [Rhodosporidiobolus lusitaniae]
MSGYDSTGPATKRRRTAATQNHHVHAASSANQLLNAHHDLDWQPQPTTARAKANARAQQQHRYSQYYGQEQPQGPKQPVLSLSSLPPAALQRYLSRYGLLTPSSSLSYHHSVFPVPPLPSSLHPPLNRETRSLNYRTAKQTYDPARRNARLAAAEGPTEGEKEGEGEKKEEETGRRGQHGRKRKWVEPRMQEFMGLNAFDPPEKVLERLAAKATAHWEKRDTIKEAETLTNFMFSCRSRGHTLRATPAG